MNAPVSPSTDAFAIHQHLYRHVDVIVRIHERLQRRFDELIDASGRKDDATGADLHRAIAKLDAVLEDIVDNYHRLLALCVPPEDAEWREAIAAIYRQHLARIGDFIQEMARTLTDPALTEGKTRDVAGGRELSFTLDLSCPAEMLRVREMMREERERLRRVSEMADSLAALAGHATTVPSRPPRLGILGTLSALLVGVGAARSMFGPRSERDR